MLPMLPGARGAKGGRRYLSMQMFLLPFATTAARQLGLVNKLAIKDSTQIEMLREDDKRRKKEKNCWWMTGS